MSVGAAPQLYRGRGHHWQGVLGVRLVEAVRRLDEQGIEVIDITQRRPGGFGVSIFFAEDSKSGLIERFRALPMARSAVVGGREFPDILRQAALLAMTTLVGIAVGFRFAGSYGGIVLAYLIALVWGFALFWVVAAIGLFVRDTETAQVASTPFFILVFGSSAIIDVDTLPGWLQPFARNQPLSQVCNAMRGLMDGSAGAAPVDHSTTHYVITSFIWCAAITAVFAPLAIYAYRRP